ncbi:hypothetical protein [Cyclobacterium xiamenense]|uniref:hypothetical protein n=1 Tax=Cyclobacterium xiamenense TaxID=1297121 RepID=UPI0035D03243
MKGLIIISIILLRTQVYANMANPVIEGTLGGRPFVSEYVDVIHEDLFIKIDENFEYASFNVKYNIHSSKDGFQIPFLFYASEYLDSFSVKIDGKEVGIHDIPLDFKIPENTKFQSFSYLFEGPSHNNYGSVIFEDSANRGFYVSLYDMIYFETDILKGNHIIEVSYRATRWTDRQNWVNDYSFRYALSPAKYWKSFGTLKIKVDASDFGKELKSNLGATKNGDLKSIAIWEFNIMPTEILQISFTPKISKTAQMLINLTPNGLAYITGVFLAILDLLLVIWYRAKNQLNRFSLVVILGSILIPLIFLITWMNYYNVIDAYIGEHAAGTHAYSFFVLFLYPALMPIYWLIYWFIDKRIKKKYEVHHYL